MDDDDELQQIQQRRLQELQRMVKSSIGYY